MPTTLPILHFNDVYRVGSQKIAGKGTIDVTQFASMLDSLRNAWPLGNDGARDGLVLFSGDLFAPSVESSVTRGSHMVPVINELAPDVAVTGNHEFDFGYPQLKKLVNETKFPWLLSNIVDEVTSSVPQCLHEFHIVEKCEVRIGFIGLVEREWIATVPDWPSNFKYRDMTEVAFDLSNRLRDPEGEYRCDLIIALTHSRLPNDIRLAKNINALLPDRRSANFDLTHGADLVLGGHDHFYYVSRGVTSWEGHDRTEDALGQDLDEGDVLIIKSGTDFRDLTELLLDLEDAPSGSVRRKVIKGLRGKRHQTQPGSISSQRLKDILSTTLNSVSETLRNPLFKVENQIDLRSDVIRTRESASGNWFADVIRHAYDDALHNMGIECVDGVLLCAGALRGDTVYGPGDITLGDVMEILPFDDSIVALEIDGRTIWRAFEAGLSTWPAQEGRFPVISGFRVIWDSRRPAGQRVLRIDIPRRDRADKQANSCSTTECPVEYEEVERTGEIRKYVVITRGYMAEGYDGYTCLKGQKTLIDKEQGQIMSAIVQKYLEESKHRKQRNHPSEGLENTLDSISGPVFIPLDQIVRIVKGQFQRLWVEAMEQAIIHWNTIVNRMKIFIQFTTHRSAPFPLPSRVHIGNITGGAEKRKTDQEWKRRTQKTRSDLLVLIPVVDGRLRDVGRP